MAKININGEWKSTVGIQLNVNGTWRTVTSGQINMAGEWKNIYTASTSGSEYYNTETNNVYYSVCPYGTSGDLKTGSPTITITSGVAYLTEAQTGNIGQGCKITYDTSSICYISKVHTASIFNVITVSGVYPSNCSGLTVDSIKHTFAGLNAAITGADGSSYLNTLSLVTAGVVLNLVCYYDHDDYTTDASTALFEDWTTSTTRYINVYTPIGGTQSIINQRHAGVWSATTAYRIEATAGSNYGVIQIGDANVYIDGLQIKLLDTTGTNKNGVIAQGAGGPFRVTNCIIKGVTTNSGTHRGIYISSGAAVGTYVIANNIIYDFVGNSASVGIGSNYASTSCYVYTYNNTVYNCDIGIYRADASSRVVAKNNIVQGCTTCYSGTFRTGTTHNLSEDSTAPALGTYYIDQSVDFVDEANDNYHLAATATNCIGSGTNLYADSYYPFQTDIDGQDRGGAGASWDLGADEY